MYAFVAKDHAAGLASWLLAQPTVERCVTLQPLRARWCACPFCWLDPSSAQYTATGTGVFAVHHDRSSTVATWLSFGVTAVGLGGLISQANAINDKMDPFSANRNVDHLGVWFKRRPQFPWWVIAKPTPVGPVLRASLAISFCDRNTIHSTRLPLTDSGPAGTASWAVLLSLFHTAPPDLVYPSSDDAAEKGGSSTNGSLGEDLQMRFKVANPGQWDYVHQQNLQRYGKSACVTISQTTLITVLCLTNVKKVYQDSDATGLRAAYVSYSGQWLITWPIGQEAIVNLAPHDSHSSARDVYPPSFIRRVDCCVNMLSGIVPTSGGSIKTAFCGRKPAGKYRLKHMKRGFPGAHGSRHLYNMMGGRVFEVDFMFAAPGDESTIGQRILQPPSRDGDGTVEMAFGKTEENIIKITLDSLPWSTLSWSIHRGMRDILLAYGRPVMDQYRHELADLLKQTVSDSPHLLEDQGWNPTFVRSSMGEMAYSAVLSCGGDSGDLVRLVTGIAQARVGNWALARLDEVDFWRRKERILDEAGIVALTKFFVLEWSNELDYQLYHQLPLSMYFG